MFIDNQGPSNIRRPYQMRLPLSIPYTPLRERFVLSEFLDHGEDYFETFAYYYQNIQKNMKRDDKGQFVDAYGNIVRYLRMDILGNLESLFIVAPFGDAKLVFQGSPNAHFEVQGNLDSDLYRYIFEGGQLTFVRKYDESKIYRGKYKNGILISEHLIDTTKHLFSEKKWSEDGKTLLKKKESFFDEQSLRHINVEFVAEDGKRYERRDLEKDGKLWKTEMFQKKSPNSTQLLWSCERQPNGKTSFYDGQGRLAGVEIVSATAKKYHINLQSSVLPLALAKSAEI